jgi:hypothetical protein
MHNAQGSMHNEPVRRQKRPDQSKSPKPRQIQLGATSKAHGPEQRSKLPAAQFAGTWNVDLRCVLTPHARAAAGERAGVHRAA